MAKKKAIKIAESSLPDETKDLELASERTWKQWLRQTYYRYWFIIVCVIFDSWVPLQLWISFRTNEVAVLGLIILFVMVFMQIRMYRQWWPSVLKIERE
jgi:hypothetical protein